MLEVRNARVNLELNNFTSHICRIFVLQHLVKWQRRDVPHRNTTVKTRRLNFKNPNWNIFDICIKDLTFLTSSCVVRCWTSSNWWWVARLPTPVKVVFIGVVPVAKVFLKSAVPFGRRLCCWWSWCSGEGCWPSRSMETPRNIWNRTVPATSTRLALWWRDS